MRIDKGGLFIGQEQGKLGAGFAASQSLRGTLDEFTIWGRALTSTEIHDVHVGNIASTDSSLRLYLPFDEGAGRVAADRGPVTQNASFELDYDTIIRRDEAVLHLSLNESIGATQVAATGPLGENFTAKVPRQAAMVPAGRVGNAIQFTPGGTGLAFDDTISAGQFGASGSYAVELWFRSDQGQAAQTLFALTGANGGHLMLLETAADQTLRFLHRVPAGDHGGSALVSSLQFQANTWHHVVAINDGGLLRLFLDGVENPTTVASTGAFNVNANLTVGAFREGGTEGLFLGSIDEVALYDVAIAPATIQRHYSAGISADPTAELQGGPGFPTAPTWTTDVPESASNQIIAMQNGIYTLRVVARDDDGGYHRVVTNFDVENVAPVIADLSYSGSTPSIGQPIHLSASNFSDPGIADRHEFLWTLKSNNGHDVLSSDAERFSFIPAFAGDYEVSLTVTDDAGASDTFTQVFSIAPIAIISTAPTLGSDSGSAILLPPRVGSVISLVSSGSSALAEAGALRGEAIAADREYHWVVTHESTTVATGTSESIDFVPVFVGDYEVELLITDVLHEDLTQWMGVLNQSGANDYAPISTRSVGGTLQARAAGGYLADTTLSRTFDPAVDSFSASGTVDFDNPNNADTNVRFGFFDTGNFAANNETFGIAWGAADGNQLTVRNSRGGSAVAIPAGEYTWSMTYDPLINDGRLTIAVGAITRSVNNLRTSGLVFNAFGIVQPNGSDATTFEMTLSDISYSGGTPLSRLSDSAAMHLTVDPAPAITVGHPRGVFLEGRAIQVGLENLAAVVAGGARDIVWSVMPEHASISPSSDETILEFIPERDGEYTISATVTDTINGTEIVRTSFRVVTIENDKPTISAAGASGFEGTPVSISAAVFDPGVDDSHTFVLDFGDGSSELSGSVVGGVVSAEHTYVQDGAYVARLTVTDSDGAVSTQQILVTIANVRPVAEDDVGVFTTTEDDVLTIPASAVLGNDSDAGLFDVLSILSVDGVSSMGAIIVLNSAGSIVYDPTAVSAIQALANGESVVDVFSYVVTDDAGGTDTGLIEVTVTGLNDVPLIPPTVRELTEDADDLLEGDLLSGASDIDTSNHLTVIEMQGSADDSSPLAGQFGAVVWSETGEYTYDLDNTNSLVQALAFGQQLVETFAFKITDGFVMVPQTLTIIIRGVNDAPLAVNETLSVNANSSIIRDADTYDDAVFANEPIAYYRMGDRAGTVIINERSPATPDGRIVGSLRPAPSLIAGSPSGALYFDGSTFIDIADDVAINVYPTPISTKSFSLWFRADQAISRQVLMAQGNELNGFNVYVSEGNVYFGAWNNGVTSFVSTPVVANKNYHLVTTFDSGVLSIHLNGVLQTASVAPAFTSVPSHPGSVTIAGSGGVLKFHDGDSSNAPQAFFTGILDEVAQFNSRLSSETVVNHYLAAGLLSADVDIDQGDSLSITAVNGISSSVGQTIELESGALLQVNADGSYAYQPNGAFDYLPLNIDSHEVFTYTATDQSGASSIGTVTIQVRGVNDAPTAIILSDNILQTNASLNSLVGELTVSDPDLDAAHSFTLLDDAEGRFTIVGNQVLLADNSLLVAGERFVVSIRATDAHGEFIDQEFAISVVPVPVQPNLVVNLADVATEHVLIRRSGEDLWVVDVVSGNLVVPPQPVSQTSSVHVVGRDSIDESLVVDYAVGGFFALSQGVLFTGGNDDQDRLTIRGDSASVHSSYQATANGLGNATVVTTAVNQQTRVRFSGIEPLDLLQMASIDFTGAVDIGASHLTLESVAPIDLSSSTLIQGGTLQAIGLLVLDINESLIGHGSVLGRIAAELGSSIVATGPLTLGDANALDGFYTRGLLSTNQHPVILLDANQAVLGSLTQLGNADGPGSLQSDNGLILDFGHNLVGYGVVNTPNDATKIFMINGAVAGVNTAQPIALDGFIKGVGTLDHVVINGTYSPGFSPAIIQNGSLTYGGGSTTVVEIGGTTPGSSGHDQINHTGTVTLAGTLDVRLLNDYEAALGQSFVLLTSSSDIQGEFDNVGFPVAPEGTGWSLVTAANELRLELVDLVEVLDVVVGDGQSNQRSSIDRIMLTFDGAVDIDLDAFSVLRRGVGGGMVNTAFTTEVDAQGNTLVTITFSGDFTRGGFSLTDGNYQLQVDSSKVRRAGTLVGLDGNGDGQVGGDFIFGDEEADQFFSFFGDDNGDRSVGLIDFLQFRNAFGSSQGDDNFRDHLDFNDDDAVGLLDFLAFRNRFGNQLPFE